MVKADPTTTKALRPWTGQRPATTGWSDAGQRQTTRDGTAIAWKPARPR